MRLFKFSTTNHYLSQNALCYLLNHLNGSVDQITRAWHKLNLKVAHPYQLSEEQLQNLQSKINEIASEKKPLIRLRIAFHY